MDFPWPSVIATLSVLGGVLIGGFLAQRASRRLREDARLDKEAEARAAYIREHGVAPDAIPHPGPVDR